MYQNEDEAAPAYLIEKYNQHFIIQPPPSNNRGYGRLSLKHRLNQREITSYLKEGKSHNPLPRTTLSNNFKERTLLESKNNLSDITLYSVSLKNNHANSDILQIPQKSSMFEENIRTSLLEEQWPSITSDATILVESSDAAILVESGDATRMLDSSNSSRLLDSSDASRLLESSDASRLLESSNACRLETSCDCGDHLQSALPSHQARSNELFRTSTIKRNLFHCFSFDSSTLSRSVSKFSSVSSTLQSQKQLKSSEKTDSLYTQKEPEASHKTNSSITYTDTVKMYLPKQSIANQGHSLKQEYTEVLSNSDGIEKMQVLSSPSSPTSVASSQFSPVETTSSAARTRGTKLRRINLQEYRARKSAGSEKSEKEKHDLGSSVQDLTSRLFLNEIGADGGAGTKNISLTNKVADEHGVKIGREATVNSKPAVCRNDVSNKASPSNCQLQQQKPREKCVHCGTAAVNLLPHCLNCKNLLPGRSFGEKQGMSPDSLLHRGIARKIRELSGKETVREESERERNLFPFGDDRKTSDGTLMPKQVFYSNKKRFDQNCRESDTVGEESECEEPVILTLSSDEEDEGKDLTNTSFSLLNGSPMSVFRKSNFVDVESNNRSRSPSIFGGGSSDSTETMHSEFEDGGDFISLKGKHVFVGTYLSVPKDRIKITRKQFVFTLPSLVLDEPVKLILKTDRMYQIVACFEGDYTAFVLYLPTGMSSYVRRLLGMTHGNGPFFQPSSKSEHERRLVIVAEAVDPEVRYLISNFFLGKKCNLNKYGYQNDLYQDLEESQFCEIIKKYKFLLEPDSFVPTKSNMKQESKELLVYPPPPHEGRIPISKDDYCCLEEEQFLNDVIIDFYLKWLMTCRLSKEDRERTHVLSTFFYKCLTKKHDNNFKGRRAYSAEDDPILTPAQKRHKRVKSWTKNVDLFSKDFILIPINEHSHWFLAVICFPGLDGPVRFCDGHPVPTPKEQSRENFQKTKPRVGFHVPTDDTSERDEAEGDEDEFKEEEEGDPPFKRQKSGSSGEESIQQTPGTRVVGAAADLREWEHVPIKQPCILIFDSLSGSSRSRIVATLRDYLAEEYARRKGEVKVFSRDTMKGTCPKVPQQMNFSDCGLFTLQFAQSFFEHPLKDYRFPIRTLSDWFNQDVVGGKRKAIATLIKSLMNEQRPDNNIDLPDLYFKSDANLSGQNSMASTTKEVKDHVDKIRDRIKNNINDGIVNPMEWVDIPKAVLNASKDKLCKFKDRVDKPKKYKVERRDQFDKLLDRPKETAKNDLKELNSGRKLKSFKSYDKPSKKKFFSASSSLENLTLDQAQLLKEAKRIKVTVCDKLPTPRPMTPNPSIWAAGSEPLISSDDGNSQSLSDQSEDPTPNAAAANESVSKNGSKFLKSKRISGSSSFDLTNKRRLISDYKIPRKINLDASLGPSIRKRFPVPNIELIDKKIQR